MLRLLVCVFDRRATPHKSMQSGDNMRSPTHMRAPPPPSQITGRPIQEDVDAIQSPFAATMLESLSSVHPRSLREVNIFLPPSPPFSSVHYGPFELPCFELASR